jgi:DNA-binding response OmpR family regulator
MDALSSPEILLFGPFRFDRRGRLLFRCTEDGRYLPVSVGSRAFAVLEVLTERPGDLVSKDEIMGVAWPGLTVEEGNLIRYRSRRYVGSSMPARKGKAVSRPCLGEDTGLSRM